MNLSKISSCGFCNNIARMEVVGSVDDLQVEIDEEFGPIGQSGIIYDVIRCPKCERINIASYGWHDSMEGESEIVYEIIYPINRNTPIGLPDKIKRTFEVAEQVKSIDVNAYSILMRRLLEQVCLDREAKGKMLAKMLQDLANKGEIPKKLVSVAKGLKDFGNIGAHAGIGELTEEEIPIVESLTRAILEYIYSAPHLANLAEKKLMMIKRKKK